MTKRKTTEHAEHSRQSKLMFDATQNMLTLCKDEDLDPDFVAFVLISTGYRLALSSNPEYPMLVSKILSTAIDQALEDTMEIAEEKSESVH